MFMYEGKSLRSWISNNKTVSYKGLLLLRERGSSSVAIKQSNRFMDDATVDNFSLVVLEASHDTCVILGVMCTSFISKTKHAFGLDTMLYNLSKIYFRIRFLNVFITPPNAL
jgi:hypothetical protein